MELDKLKLLALDLISPHRPVAGNVLAALDDNDWAGIGALLRQHRLEPLLYWRLSHEKSAVPVPVKFLQRLENSFKSSTLRSLALQRELLHVHRILEQAAVPHVMLKGAFLAFHAYPHPATRPMRDLDVLIPREKALEAYQALVREGFQCGDDFEGHVAATLDTMHHLPGLDSEEGQMHVELHTRLFHPRPWKIPCPDLGEEEGFWLRRAHNSIAGTSMPFESATDLLFHMTIHAVYDHKFNNGPLLLSDLAYLLNSQAIDWPLFWRLAAERGHERGCLLALVLTEHYYGKQEISWPPACDISEKNFPIHEAALAMLQDVKFRKALLLGSNIASTKSWSERIRFFMRKVFPSRMEISAVYPVPPRSLRIYLGYPIKWWDMLKSRVPSLMHRSFYKEAVAIQTIDRWLWK